MANFTYTVKIAGNGDVAQIVRNEDGLYVFWNDADFQAWNNAQNPPYALSAAQAQIQQAKALDFPGFVTFVTNQYAALTPAQAAPPQKIMRLWHELMQRALKGEIV